MSGIISEGFYRSFSTLELAQKLLGMELVHETAEGTCSGIIVETEAYLHNDRACHAFSGITPRNRPMFGPAGFAYVYQIYGIHYCFNMVSGPDGCGEAVLIRALEPLLGIDLMQARRGKNSITDLCSGPGKLVQAMGIRKMQSCESLAYPPLYVRNGNLTPEIHTTTRIGIGKGKDEHLPYRFYIKGSKFISKP
jgi:DNA-3-methyladenine glycosylase